MTESSDLLAAAKTWNNASETIAEADARIHDNSTDLVRRADIFAETICSTFPISLKRGARILEIGSGTGYIMESVVKYLTKIGLEPAVVDGLDIAEHMLSKAKARLEGKNKFGFIYYDGISVPKPDKTYDLIYSVAALQHIPKPYVYNLFFEIRRLLLPGSYSVLNLLSWNNMAVQQEVIPWRAEIQNQIAGGCSHWHHFYSIDELYAILKVGTGFLYVNVKESSSIWLCAGDSEPSVPDNFNPQIYLRLNPDVTGMDAEAHWLEYGHREGRRWV